MDGYQRSFARKLALRLKESKPLIQVLVGPRQVGKTTGIRSILNGRGLYESADSPSPLSYTFLNEWWDKALASQDRILAIDEVQKISGWSEIIKKRWDEKPYALKVL